MYTKDHESCRSFKMNIYEESEKNIFAVNIQSIIDNSIYNTFYFLGDFSIQSIIANSIYTTYNFSGDFSFRRSFPVLLQ